MITVEDAIQYFEYEIIGAKNLLRFTKSNAEQDKIDICQMALDAIVNMQKSTHDGAYELGYQKGYADGLKEKEQDEKEHENIKAVQQAQNNEV